MAQITISFEGTAGTITKAGKVWDASQEARFLNWIWSQYAPKDEVEGSETFGEVLPRSPQTMGVAFGNFMNSIMEGTKANILRWEKEEAIKTIVQTDL